MEQTENRLPQSKRQNPLTFYLRTLLYMVMALVMRLVAFLPLGALILFPQGSYFRWLALLCPLMLIFFILPQRFSFAQALVQPARERRFSFDKATGVSNYGRKLGEALVHALNILKWGIPLWLMLGACYYFYTKLDAITLLKGIGDIGAAVVSVGFAVANFFIGIFRGTALVPNGGIMEGLYTICVVLGIGALILLWGTVRNSAYRYIWAQAMQNGQNARTEARRRLTDRRAKQMGVALINLLLWVPALFVVFTTLKGMLSNLSDTLFNYLSTKQLSLPELSNAVYPLLFAFVVCYLPLLPVRRILTCFFATKHLRHAAEDAPAVPTEEAAGKAPETTLEPAFAPAYAPVTTLELDAEEKPEPEPAPTEPAPVPAYTPDTQAAQAEAPYAAVEASPATAVPAALELAEESVASTPPEPMAQEESAYPPYTAPETATGREPETAPEAEIAPEAEAEPEVQAVVEPIAEAKDAVELTVEEPQADEQTVAAEPMPAFTMAGEREQSEAPTDEDDYIKPFAPSLFDTTDTAVDEQPDESETDR